MRRAARRWSAVLWPAFLMAAVLEFLVFSFVDVDVLHGFAGGAIDAGATAVYTVAFFVFWAAIAAAAAMSLLLSRSEAEINSRSFRR